MLLVTQTNQGVKYQEASCLGVWLSEMATAHLNIFSQLSVRLSSGIVQLAFPQNLLGEGFYFNFRGHAFRNYKGKQIHIPKSIFYCVLSKYTEDKCLFFKLKIGHEAGELFSK